jgi:hypothetical protein
MKYLFHNYKYVRHEECIFVLAGAEWLFLIILYNNSFHEDWRIAISETPCVLTTPQKKLPCPM